MATKALRPCSYPGCGALVAERPRCPAHTAAQSGAFADSSRGTRHERGYGNEWSKARIRILQRDAGLCQLCLAKGIVNYCAGKKFGAQVDHIVPKFEGGTDEDDNLQTVCVPCHKEKTASESARAQRNGAW